LINWDLYGGEEVCENGTKGLSENIAL